MGARARRIALLFPFCIFLSFFCALSVQAAEEVGEDTYQSFWENLPSLAEGAVPERLTDTEALEEKLGMEAVLSLLTSSLSLALDNVGKTLLALFAFFLSARALSVLLPRESTTVRFAVSLAGTLLLARALGGSMERSFAYLEDTSRLAFGISPIYAGLYAAGGGSGTAAAASSGFFVFCTVVEWLAEGLLSPLLRILAALTVLSVTENSAVGELSKTVRGWAMALFGIFSALFPAALGFQTSLAAASDSMAARAAKYAVGNTVPVVGGALSGALGTLTSSLSLVKHTAGAAAFLAMLAITLPMLAELFLCRMLLSLFSSCSAAWEDRTAAKVFGDFRGIWDLLLAAVAAVSVVMLVILAIFARTAVATAG